MSTTITLIPTTTFGGAVGNYDGNASSFSSNIAQGDGYYGSIDGLHSVSYTGTNLLANVQMQGSLATTPTELDWFLIDNTLHSNATVLGSTVSFNFVGNFVWVRANVSAFSQGTINKVLYNHG